MKSIKRLSSLLATDPSDVGEGPLGARGWAYWVRFTLLALGLLGGVAVILIQVHEHYPIQKWLFWRYAAYWGAMGVFSAACLSVGHRITTWLFPRRAPVAEHVVVSFALGVFTFFLGMFLAGMVGLWQPWFAVAFPVVLIASGLLPSVRYGRRLVRHLRAARLRPHPEGSPWRLALFAFGVLGITALYFQLISPDNISYDARWYHLSIAEHYAAAGGIERFHEGWFQGTNPHLASILYGWGFLLPGTRLFDQAMLCAHLEMLLFLWTLAGVPPLVRRLLHGRRARYAWVATFLFPGVFLYDSNLSVGADHVGAFWAVPIFLALMRAWGEPGPRRTMVLGTFIAGALMTKYTVVILAVGPILAMVARSLWVGVGGLVRKAPQAAKSAWLGLGAFALSGLVMTAPHWLKNLIWHGDPAYPVLYKHTSPNPWTVDSALFYGIGIRDRLLAPKGTFVEKLLETLEVLFTFSFEPHNWPRFHHDVPVFGFLFTVTSVLLLTLKRTARIWGLVIVTWIGLATWVSIHARDRYLQSILPWMVVVTAAVIVLLWRSHWVHRVLLGALVGVQIIWGSDVPFFRTHAMIHDSPFKATVDFVATGFKGEYDKRLKAFGRMEEIGEMLPPDAKVLVHEEHMTLGLRSSRVHDAPGYQGGIVYGRMPSVRALYDLLRSWGVTHILWKGRQSEAKDSIGGDFVFFELATRHTTDVKRVGGWRLGRLILTPPPETGFEDVAYLACGTGYAPGMYKRTEMIVPGGNREQSMYPTPFKPLSSPGVSSQSLIEEADYVVWHPKCRPEVQRGWLSGFDRVGRRGKSTDLYIRKRPASR